MMRLALATILAITACAHDRRDAGGKNQDQTSTRAPQPLDDKTTTGGGSEAAAWGSPTVARLVTNQAEAKAAVGKRVRVHGTAEREKLGDTVSSPGFSIVCLAPRFPTGRLNQPVVVEGILELDSFQATTEQNGLISQGTGPALTFAIPACTLL